MREQLEQVQSDIRNAGTLGPRNAHRLLDLLIDMAARIEKLERKVAGQK